MNDLHVGNQEPMKIDEEIISREPKTLEDWWMIKMYRNKNPWRLRNDLHAGNQEHTKIYEFLTCWEPRTC